MRLLSFFTALLFLTRAFAVEPSLRTKITTQKSQLGIGYEFSQFSADRGSIVGTGGRVNFLHGFNDSWTGNVFLTAAINQNGDVQNSFTGLGGTVFYNLYGQQNTTTREVQLSELTVLREESRRTACLLVGGGISQYFFNGNEGVYSASGLNAAAAFQFNFWSVRWELMARYNLLGAGTSSLNGTTLSLGINIPL